MTLEMFIWNDPHTIIDEWTLLKDLPMESNRVMTIGLVVQENDALVAVAIGVDAANSQITGTLIIPKIAILKREMLADQSVIDGWLKAR